MSQYELPAEKEPAGGGHKRKRDEVEGGDGDGGGELVSGGGGGGGEADAGLGGGATVVVAAAEISGEAVEEAVEEEGFSKDDDLLLEDLINGADGLPPGAAGPGGIGGSGIEVDDGMDSDFGVVFAVDADPAQDDDEDASQIDLMAREILEDSSQSQGVTQAYGPGRKKPRRQYAPAAARTTAAGERGSEDDDNDDERVEEEDEEVEVIEEEDDDGDEEDDDASDRSAERHDARLGGKGVHVRPKRGASDDEEDDDDDDGDAEDEDDEDDEDEGERASGDGSEFRALGSKGLFAPTRDGKGAEGGKGKAVKTDDDSDDEDADEDDDEDEAAADEHADEEEDEQEEEGAEHTLTRALMDRYLDVDAKVGLLTRAVRQFDAQSQVSTLLTSALLQLANARADFAAEEEDYDSDDETEEKVELSDDETIEGWLVNADPADWEALRASFLKDLLQMPFKAKLDGERCTVVQAVGGDNLMVRQNGESFVVAATALSGAKGRNGALLAEWRQNRDVGKQPPGSWL